MKQHKHFSISFLVAAITSILLLTACQVSNTDVTEDDEAMVPLSSVSGDNTLKYGNVTINNKTGSLLGGLFCCAEDKIFFSNFNDNGYIYSYNNETEKTELVVKMPARFINYYNGDLYFLYAYDKECFETYHNVFTGELYRYDIQSGECMKLAESQIITGLVVTNEGIYYTQIPTPGSSLDPPELWQLDFGKTEAKLCDYTYLLRDEDRIIDANGIHELTDNKLGIKADVPFDIELDEAKIKGACVYQNKLFTYSDGVLSITGLTDGSIREIKMSDLENPYGEELILTDYTVLKDELYIVCGGAGIGTHLWRVNLSDNKTEFFWNLEGDGFKRLYTDEKDVYALCFEKNKMVRLDVNELNVNADKIPVKELK